VTVLNGTSAGTAPETPDRQETLAHEYAPTATPCNVRVALNDTPLAAAVDRRPVNDETVSNAAAAVS
jgi:hypothetical protein